MKKTNIILTAVDFINEKGKPVFLAMGAILLIWGACIFWWQFILVSFSCTVEDFLSNLSQVNLKAILISFAYVYGGIEYVNIYRENCSFLNYLSRLSSFKVILLLIFFVLALLCVVFTITQYSYSYEENEENDLANFIGLIPMGSKYDDMLNFLARVGTFAIVVIFTIWQMWVSVKTLVKRRKKPLPPPFPMYQ